MLDRDPHRAFDDRMRPIGEPETGGLQHRNVVSAIPDRERQSGRGTRSLPAVRASKARGRPPMTGLVVIGGPTASGKSALALRLAETVDGVLINADSRQLYRELPLLTARPSPADEAKVPHRLFGILAADRPASAGAWLELTGQAIAAAREAGKVPIVVGGTGLYLSALLRGLAPVPPVPAAARAEAQALFERLGGPGLHAELGRRDPVMAARLRPSDRQRLIRAFEVLAATGRSLSHWQALPRVRVPLPRSVVGIALLPPRAALHARIERRLRAMLAAGALEELRALRLAYPDTELPLLNAVAAPELLDHLEGRLELAPALARALARTRQFAKRQVTWLRHQLPELEPAPTFGDDPAIAAELRRRLLLTDAALPHSFRSSPEPGPRNPAHEG
jgi:tRNA dimethylallyltransferase